VYAARAGETKQELIGFVWWTLVARGGRILGLGALLALAGTALRPLLRRWYAGYLGCLSIVFAVSLSNVVHSWSEHVSF
jgi:hypothetical protein